MRVEAEADRQAPARLVEIARDLAALDELRARTSTLRRQLLQEPASTAAPAFESRRLHVVA